MIDIESSATLTKYKDTLRQCISLYYPEVNSSNINAAIDYSIQKRMKDSKAAIVNSYKRRRVTEDGKAKFIDARQETTLQKISDYIISRQPIVTAYGTMFMHHGTVPNPMGDVVQSFLDLRSAHKKEMFKYPKGSEDFEKYNLLQQLDKIDCNGIYGCIGMYSCLLYNNNVATSITSQGRALVSSMTLHFEMFLGNNVKFGSLNEVLESINHICSEAPKRKFNDLELLSHIPSREECFAKVILSCGYRWIPNEKEMEIIWKVINNLNSEDVTRIYYKNNLYEFCMNKNVIELIKTILKKLERPLYNSLKIPPEITNEMNLLVEYMMEYVYYRYMFIDRIDRCDNMIKAITMVSDTDSTIISLDAWYRFVLGYIYGEPLRINNYCPDPVTFIEKDENGDWKEKPWMKVVDFQPKVVDYNFELDEVVELERFNRPEILTNNDNLRYSIINIMAHILDRTVNDYMEKFCENTYSLQDPYHNKCKILAKNEFLFRRLMMTQVKKNYASLVEVQEGNMVPESKQLDVKGIEALTKSSKPIATRKALQKILLDDILKAPVIDQLKFVKDIAIFEHQILDSIRSGKKEFLKPVTIKSKIAYDDPMRIQGIKASVAWNMIRSKDNEAINLDERNAIDIVKVIINRSTVEKIKDKYPENYANMIAALDDDAFKTYVKNPKTGIKDKLVSNEIDAVAIPLDTELPPWLEPFIDYNAIITDNIGGFPYESIGIQRLQKNNINYTNIVQL